MKPIPDYPKEIHIILAVWGKEFWANYLKSSLLTRLTPNNFKELAKHFVVRYKIFTTEEDLHKYSNAPEIKLLNETVQVSFHPIQLRKIKCKYTLFSNLQNTAIQEARLNNAGLIFDSPDHIYSNSIFGSFVPLIKKGKRLLLTSGVRLCLEEFLTDPLVNKQILDRTDFDNKDLMTAALRNLHPYATKFYFKENSEVINWTSQIFWKLNENNFAQALFHMHPFFVWPQMNRNLACQTIDYGEFLYKVCPDRSTHHICTEAQFTYFELSKKNYAKDFPKKKPTLLAYLYWMKSFAHPFQIASFYKIKFYLSSKLKMTLFRKCQIYSFIFSLYLLNLLPLFLIKPFLHKHHQKFIEKEVRFLFFLKKVRIWNYYEALLRNNYKEHIFDDLLEYINSNLPRLRYELLRKVLANAFFSIENSHYLASLNKLREIIPDIEFLGQFTHEAVKIRNFNLVNTLVDLKIPEQISRKQFGYFIKELAVQNYHELFLKILNQKEVQNKIKSYFLQRSLLPLTKNKAFKLIPILLTKIAPKN